MSCVNIALEVASPIMLTLVVDNGFCIIPDAVPAEEPLFVASEAFKFESGDKARLDSLGSPKEGDRYSSVHAGVLGETSITDDYFYVCVKTGSAGNAIWKRTVLFYSA